MYFYLDMQDLDLIDQYHKYCAIINKHFENLFFLKLVKKLHNVSYKCQYNY